MPNKETTPQQQYVDERLMVRLSHDVARPMANTLTSLNELIHNIENRDPAEPTLPVLRRERDAQMQLFDRLEELMRGLAENKVRIVREGALVHAVAERLAMTANAHGQYDDDNRRGKEEYIGVSQGFLAELKRTEVIL